MQDECQVDSGSGTWALGLLGGDPGINPSLSVNSSAVLASLTTQEKKKKRIKRKEGMFVIKKCFKVALQLMNANESS